MKKTEAHRCWRSMTNLSVLLALAMSPVLSGQSFATVYVDTDAPPGGDGNSWGTAYQTIQAGIDDADTLDEEVWVAEGTYTESITMKDGVAVYGGFTGTETLLPQRDFETNVTIIDASTVDGGRAHVAVMNNITNSRIDGFTITGGNADRAAPHDLGGGIFCSSVNDTNTIANCTITANTAYDAGGGMCCIESSSPTITNCIFSGNTATNESGGGLHCYDNCSATISNCTFEANEANWYGGGLYCDVLSSTLVVACSFSNNLAHLNGGGLCIATNSPATVANCIFCDNWAFSGGALCTLEASPTIVNCTISDNLASSQCGGLYVRGSPSPTVLNSIFFNNSHHAIYEGSPSSDPEVRFCLFDRNDGGDYYDFDEGTTYTGADNINTNVAGASDNIDGDPFFVNTAVRDYHLKRPSPCIDTGTEDGAPSTDMDDNRRPIDIAGLGAEGTGTEFDIGADEFSFDTDGDRLQDEDETRDLDPDTPGTQNPFDPYDPDTTGDGFSDAPDGVPDGWNDYDGDGMSNADEFTFGYNPIDPGSWAEVPTVTVIGLAMVLVAVLLVARSSIRRRLGHKRA